MAVFVKSYLSIYLYFVLINSCYLSEIKLGVLLPTDSNYPWNVQRVMPAIQIAVERVSKNILPGSRITTVTKDTECSATVGPLAAIDLYMNEHVHVLFGPVCNYALAPVARYSPHWNIPVITAGALVQAFDNKMEYKLLTRIIGTYSKAAEAFIDIAKSFNWTKFGLIYQDNRQKHMEKSDCFFNMEALFKKVSEADHKTSSWYRKFYEGAQVNEFDEILHSASLNARIIVLCGSLDSVREIMIKAHELNFDNGDYVFFHYDLFSSTQHNQRPWFRENDTSERNDKARKAYEALMIFSLRQQTSSEFKHFSDEVKRRAKHHYENVAFGEGKVNQFVGAFHDAVILYGLALNETLEANGSATNGTEVTLRMVNTTFQGITGIVSIDSSGDRNADYSLMDMDPVSGIFQMVMNYLGRTRSVEFVAGKQIHWAGDYESAPPDTPKCGFDNLGCAAVSAGIDEKVVASTLKPKENNVEQLLDNLHLTMTKITEAIVEHNASLSEITKLVQKEHLRSSAHDLPCPQASTSRGSRNTGIVYILSSTSCMFLITIYALNRAIT